ncbi:hypothetical protein H0H81_009025 [Sphagnurus paluster]|uniref:Uncharacterized protein n=1 Tax=Sphagnurus paluster TaxID=117069 RepID=A0A9P7GQL8_9AGAR|nr:hypothetical protein H0H81_009025 [Sphagnurus paluster]
MARARRSLSPNSASLLVRKHKTSRVFEEKLAAPQARDLEDGEISDLEDVNILEAQGKAGVEMDVERTITEANAGSPESGNNKQLEADYRCTEPPSTHINKDASQEQSESASIDAPVAAATPEPEKLGPHALSPEELDLAKSIVLDLLGWGVEPEYLIESKATVEPGLVILRTDTG